MAESVTKFGAIDESFSKTISTMEGRLQGFNGAIETTSSRTFASSAAFAAATVAITAMASAAAAAAGFATSLRTAMDFADKIQDLSNRTGETKERLVVLQRAFENTGAAASDVGPALAKLQGLIGAAGEGSEKAKDKLAKLGLSFQDLKDMSPAVQLMNVLDGINRIPDPSERARRAIDTFGQSLGPKLIPLIKDFDGEIEKAVGQLGSFHGAVETYGKSLADLQDVLQNIGNKFLEFSMGLTGPVAESLLKALEPIQNFDATQLGLKLGEAVNDALNVLMTFVENAKSVLSGIWDGMSGTVKAALEEIAEAFNALGEVVQPYVDRISEHFRNLDYPAIGRKIGEQFAYALEVARGLLEDPAAIFGLYSKYLDFTFRKAADDLLSLFVTALEAVGRFLLSMLGGEFWNGIAKIFANSLILGIAEINLKFIGMVENVMRFFARIWDVVTGEGVSGFAGRLFNLITSFGSDFLKAITNPLGFITGKLASALMDGTKQGADAYQINFDRATGGIIAQTRAGLEGLGQTASRNMAEGFGQVTSALTRGVGDAVTQTEGFKSNLFGSAEAGERLKKSTDQLADNGRALLGSTQEARTNIEASRLEAQITADIYTGNGGIVQSLNQAAATTSAASEQIVTAYNNVATTGQQFNTSAQSAGTQFKTQAVDAGKGFSQQVQQAMRDFTSATRGLATERTLLGVVSQLQLLNRKLPQPVLI